MSDEYQLSSIQPVVLSSNLTATSLIVWADYLQVAAFFEFLLQSWVCKIENKTAFSALKLIKEECLYWQARNWTKYKNMSFKVSLIQLYIANRYYITYRISQCVGGWCWYTGYRKMGLSEEVVKAIFLERCWARGGWVGGCLTGTICLSRYFIYISSWQTREVARFCMRENQYESIGELGTNIGWRTIGVLQIKSLPSGRQCC